MSDQTEQDTPSAEVEVTGHLADGRVTVEAKLGGATLSFSWEVDADEGEIDILLGAAPTFGMTVVERLVEEQEADRG